MPMRLATLLLTLLVIARPRPLYLDVRLNLKSGSCPIAIVYNLTPVFYLTTFFVSSVLSRLSTYCVILSLASLAHWADASCRLTRPFRRSKTLSSVRADACRAIQALWSSVTPSSRALSDCQPDNLAEARLRRKPKSGSPKKRYSETSLTQMLHCTSRPRLTTPSRIPI